MIPGRRRRLYCVRSISYKACIDRLYNVNTFHKKGVKLGLSNMHQLDSIMDHPSSSYKSFHVAGSNGKGTVCYKISNALMSHKYQTGLFVSPHIKTFRERIQINGQLIPETDVADILSTLFDKCEEHGVPATFFEYTTMLAMEYFKRQHVDFAVFETGLGGRLDSTNILQSPIATVITSISLEHTRVLGNTISLIASEKAGIIKPFVPTVIGDSIVRTPEAHDVIRNRATELNSPLIIANNMNSSKNNVTEDTEELSIDLARTALSLAKVVDVKESALRAKPPCRFQVEKMLINGKTVKVVLDVAHNVASITKLVDKLLAAYNCTFRVVCGFSSDKDIRACVSEFKRLQQTGAVGGGANIHFVTINDNRRCASPERISHEFLSEVHPTDVTNVKDGIRNAISLLSDDEILVICGSVFLMEPASKALGARGKNLNTNS